jgi:hypothetical protein
MLASSDSESSYSTCRDPCRGNRTAVRVFEYSTCCTVLPCFGQHCIIGSGTADSVLVSRRSHKTKLLLTSPRSRPYTEFWASIGHTRSTLLQWTSCAPRGYCGRRISKPAWRLLDRTQFAARLSVISVATEGWKWVFWRIIP